MEVIIQQGYFDGLMSETRSIHHDLKDPRAYKYFNLTTIPALEIYHRDSDIGVDVRHLSKDELLMFLKFIETNGVAALEAYQEVHGDLDRAKMLLEGVE